MGILSAYYFLFVGLVMTPKRPSHWAGEILAANTDDAKAVIFKTIPERYRKWVIDLVVSAEEIKAKRPAWLTARIKMKRDKKNGTTR